MRLLPGASFHSIAPLAAPVALLVVLGFTLALPKPDGDQRVARPPRPTVVAAIHHGRAETVTGRITSLQPAGMVLRVLIGIRRVATLHRTVYTGSGGARLDRRRLRRGDSVRVVGFLAGQTLLATSVADLSRQ